MILQYKKYLIILLVVFNVFYSYTENEQKPFSFVQLCDTQLGFGLEGYENDLKKFKWAVAQINELNPDFVVICGDLVNDPSDSSYSDFLEIKQGFKMPCYLVPGNHDVGNLPNDKTLSYYRKTIGKDYYEFHNKGISFIVTNTQLWKVNVENESEKHDNWFKETLKKQSIKQNPVFVIGHYPLYTKIPEEEETYSNFPLIKRQEMLKLFLQNNVIAYLSGHRHMVVINNYENIQLVSGETISRNFYKKRPFGFRLWQVSSDTIKHHFVALQPSVIKQQLWIAQWDAEQLQLSNERPFAKAGDGPFGPDGIAIDEEENIYTAVFNEFRINVYNNNGLLMRHLSCLGSRPTSCAFDLG